MNVRSLMAGGITPLVLVTGLAMASVAGISVRRELERSAGESALAGARAVSAFVAAWEAEGRPWEAALRRLVGFGQILEIQVQPGDGSAPRSVAAASWAAGALSGALPPAAAGHLERGEPWAGGVERVSGEPVARAFAPLDGAGSGFVAVVMSVAPLVAEAERLRPRFVLATAIFTVLALLAALLSGRWLGLGVRSLEAQARNVAAGVPTAPGPGPGPGARELADLALAFQTLKSVLDDSVAQGRRALLARPLTQAVRSVLLSGPEAAGLDVTLAGHRVTAHTVGRSGPGLLAGAMGDARRAHAFAGRAAGSDGADRSLEAAAARLFLEARLAAGGDPEEAVHAVKERFALESLCLAVWTAEDKTHRRVHTLPDDAEHALDVLELFFSDRDQQAAGTAIGGALHDLGPGLLVLARPIDTRPAPSQEVS